MCELMAIAYSEPRPAQEVLALASDLDRLGVTGFGWGMAWLENGALRGYRHPTAMADDPVGVDRLREVASARFLIHLRRPSKLSTVQLADTQPFLDEAGRFAFCHNGYLDRHQEYRPRYAERLAGRADSEVGFRVFQDSIAAGVGPAEALSATFETMGGRANFGYLGRDGTLLVYAANPGNAMWVFRLGDAHVASTALHSDDESLFDLLFREAVDAERVTGGVGAVGGRTAAAA